jgi:hypothetical protein
MEETAMGWRKALAGGYFRTATDTPWYGEAKKLRSGVGLVRQMVIADETVAIIP